MKDQKLALPITIKQAPAPANMDCEFTVKMPWEMANALVEAFAPIIQQLSASAEVRQKHEWDRLSELSLMRDAHKKMIFIALKCMRYMRKSGDTLEVAVQGYALHYNLAEHELQKMVRWLMQKRLERYRSWQYRKAHALIAIGAPGMEISRQCKLPVSRVKSLMQVTDDAN